MKSVIFLFFPFLMIGCSTNQNVYWCGDHPCINKKERKAYFEKTMIVEIKEINKIMKKEDISEIEKLTNQARSSEKKRIKDEKELAKQVKLEEKKRIKDEKNLAKQMKLEEKIQIKNEKKLAKQARLEEKKINKKNKKSAHKKNKSIKEKEILLSSKEIPADVSDFRKLVEIIAKKNMLRDYPNINDIPN